MKKRILILFLLTISLFAKNNLPQKHILVLHSYNKSMGWETNIDRAINDTLQPNKNNYIIHTEYMDTKRIFTKNYLQNLKQLYKIKYHNVKFDLILASDNNAFDFLRKNRDELFGNVPVSFCGVNFFKDSDLDGLANYTGVAEIFNAKKTVNIALKLDPNIKNIYVVNDYLTTGKAWTKTIKEQLKGIDKNIIYLKNSSIEELKIKLKLLNKKDTMVLLGVYFKDKNGKYFTYEKIGKIVSQSSNAPVFCLLQFNMGKGVVGGSVIGGYFQGEAMSKIAKKILNGTLVKDIPVRKDGATKLVLDYNSLVKYNMDIKAIPNSAIIINKPISFFEKNKSIIITSLFITFILLIIIVILLMNIKQRKKVQALLRKSQNEIKEINKNLKSEVQNRTLELEKQKETFEAIYNGSKDAIAILDMKSNFLQVNPAYIEITGFTKKELLNTSCLNLTAQKDIQPSKDAMEEIMKVGFIKNFEKECIIKDNKILLVNMSISLLHNPDRILISVRDVTELKKKEKLMFEQSKMASMGEMIGNIAHQWRQPLSVISTAASGMKIEQEYNMLKEEDISKMCDAINDNAQYLSKTIDDFRNFIKGDSTKKIFNFKKGINNFLNLINGSMRDNNINMILDLQEGIEIDGYENELNQCLMNIFNNAKDELIKKETNKDRFVFISTSTSEENIIIKIKDNAGGIPKDIINKIFEPYFTTKHQSQGTGIGLHMTYNLIVDGMGGNIEATNVNYRYGDNEYVGAEFIITLPLN